MRQIQALAEQASAARASAAEQEQQLLGRLRAAEQTAAEATAAERDASGKAASAEAALQATREAAAVALQVCQCVLAFVKQLHDCRCLQDDQAAAIASKGSVMMHARCTLLIA
jgi:hypothetical protein